MKKKGVIEVQFNWIFILFVGAIILMFFLGLAQWYMNTQNAELAEKLSTELENLITAAQATDNTVYPIRDLPDNEIQFRCLLTDDSSLGVSDYAFERSSPKITKLDPLFTPGSMETSTIYSWTVDWKYPFKVASLLYLTSPNHVYYFVYDTSTGSFALDELIDELKDTIPSSINAQWIDLNGGALADETLEYERKTFVKFIFISEVPEVHPEFAAAALDQEVTAVNFSSSQRGKISFLKKEGATFEPDEIDGAYHPSGNPENTFDYFDVPMLVGAIISDNSEFYVCNQRKMFKRLSIISQVYEVRSEELDDFSPTPCGQGAMFDSARDKFDSIGTSAAAYLETLDPVTGDDLHDLKSQLANEYQTAIINSCRRLY